MHLFYIDESGDVGTVNSPSKFFVLSSICVHESNWQGFIDDLILFRKHLKDVYGLRMKEEIHASVFINGNPNLRNNVSKNQKILILRDCIRFLNSRKDISIVTVRIDKHSCAQKGRDIFNFAWEVLLQRIDNTLKYGNFIGGTKEDKGLIINDDTDGEKLRKILRRMRRYNKVPSKYTTPALDAKLTFVIEDPVSRDSKTSYIHQMVDVVCYFGRQYYEPNKTIRKKGIKQYYNQLVTVVNPYVSPKNKINYILEL